MSLSRPRLLLVLAAVLVICLAVFLLVKIDEPEAVQTSTERTIVLGTFSKALGNAPYHVAHHFQWFESEPALDNFRFEYREFNDRPTISVAFDQGDLDVLFSGDAPAVLCRAQGNDIRVVAVSGNANQEILVPTSSLTRNLSDLRGKKIAVLQATSSHYCLLKLLREFQIAPADVNLVYMPPAEAKTAFETDQLEAWAVWAPFVEQQQANGKGRILPGSAALINSIVTVNESLLNENEPAVRAIVGIIQRAKTWMASHPKEAQEIAANELGLDPKVVAIAWPKFNWSAKLDETVITDLQAKADFLAAQEKTRLGRALNISQEFVDPRYTR